MKKIAKKQYSNGERSKRRNSVDAVDHDKRRRRADRREYDNNRNNRLDGHDDLWRRQ